MALLTPGSRPDSSIPTSSMADIAFLLLVFFLVTTVFPKDKGLALALPHQPGDVSPQNVLILLVQETGIIEARLGSSPNVERLTAREVEGVWRRHVASNPNLIAALKTSPEAAYSRMVDVLDALHSAGAQRISLQVLPRGP